MIDYAHVHAQNLQYAYFNPLYYTGEESCDILDLRPNSPILQPQFLSLIYTQFFA